MIAYVVGLQDWRWVVGTGVCSSMTSSPPSPMPGLRLRRACSAHSFISEALFWPLF